MSQFVLVSRVNSQFSNKQNVNSMIKSSLVLYWFCLRVYVLKKHLKCRNRALRVILTRA